MISGALFLNPERSISLKILYKKNINRLIIAFAFWSIVCYLLNFIFDEKYREINGAIKSFSGFGHLWFLPMLIGLYMLIPVFRPICRDSRTTLYFLIISFCLTILPYTLLESINPMISNGSINYVFTYLEILYKNTNLMYFAPYTFYFVLGYYLSVINLKKYGRWIVYFLGVVGSVLTIVLVRKFYHSLGNQAMLLYNYTNINVAFQSISIFVLIKSINWNQDNKSKRLVAFLSKQSFGVYLVHVGVLSVVTTNIIHIDKTSSPVFGVFVTWIITLVISYSISYLLNSISYINKYIV